MSDNSEMAGKLALIYQTITQKGIPMEIMWEIVCGITREQDPKTMSADAQRWLMLVSLDALEAILPGVHAKLKRVRAKLKGE